MPQIHVCLVFIEYSLL